MKKTISNYQNSGTGNSLDNSEFMVREFFTPQELDDCKIKRLSHAESNRKS
jgi:hypothetical protein